MIKYMIMINSGSPAFASAGALENADRANILDPTAVTCIGTVLDSRGLTRDVVEDAYGERYVRIWHSPEAQHFASLLMKPVCSLADVIRTSEGAPAHYSHIMNLDGIESRTPDELRAERLMLNVVLDDTDHYFYATHASNVPNRFHNIRSENGKHYFFDLGKAFTTYGVFSERNAETAVTSRVLKRLESLAHDDRAVDAMLFLLRDKTHTLRELYSGAGGYALFSAQLQKAGIDDRLTEIFGNHINRQWASPHVDFYRFFMTHVETMDKLVSDPSRVKLSLWWRRLGRMVIA